MSDLAPQPKSSVFKNYPCCECGVETPEIWERRGKLYCIRHFLDTPEKRAYEQWFVRD